MSVQRLKVPDLLGGVSQLADEERSGNQVEVLENALLSVTHGTRKRPPTSDVGLISSSQVGYDNAFVHQVNRSSTDRYTIVVANGDLKVFDTLTGAAKTVYFPNGKSYLSNTARGFRAFTVGDSTFLVNRQLEVKRGSTFSDAVEHEALLFVRQADFGTTYSVALDGEFVSVWTPGEASADSREAVSTDKVAKQLYDALRSTLTKIPTKFDISLLGSTIHVKKKDWSPFYASVSDGLSDSGLRLIKGQVQAMEDLPARARDGMRVEITGDPGSPKDNTWVVYRANQVYSPISEQMVPTDTGVWVECPAPSTCLSFDKSTMPHELVRQGYLEPVEVNESVHQHPTWSTDLGTAASPNGWTKDGNDVVLDGGETDTRVVNDSGAVRSPAVNGTHASLTRRVRVAYDLDTGDQYNGTSSVVTLSANVGAGWVVKSSVRYKRGVQLKDQVFELDMVVPAGTRFELKLETPTKLPTGGRVPPTRVAKLTAHSSSDTLPGIQVMPLPTTRISLGYPGQVWPMGLQVDLTLDATAFTYTLAADLTTQQLHTALSALIDAHASFVSAYTPPAAVTLAQADSFTVQRAATADGPAVNFARCLMNPATKFWSPNLAMTPGAYVGFTLKNITDGSTGTITANSGLAFAVAGLAGGVSNVFKEGDRCSVLGTGASYFVFRQAPWTDRLVGDEELSPAPSFVGRQINEVFFHAGRVGFTSEDFVIMTAAQDLYRFWRKTMTQVLDDDPIDINSAHKDVAMFDSVVNWDGELFLNSGAGHQFALRGDPIVSPGTVRIEHVTSFPASEKARPLALGRTVVFTRKAGSYTQVREVFKTRDGIGTRLTTDHVPRYIPGDVIDICGDADHAIMALLPDGGSRNEIYVYNFGSKGEWQQQAWSKWTFGGRILGIDMFDGVLTLVIYRGSQVRLEKLVFSDPPAWSSDHRDLGSTAYTFKATLSQPHLSERDGTPITSGRTQLRTLQVNYMDTGYLLVTITPTNRSAKTYTAGATVHEGRLRVPVLAENDSVLIELTNNQASGCAISSIEWELTYSSRS